MRIKAGRAIPGQSLAHNRCSVNIQLKHNVKRWLNRIKNPTEVGNHGSIVVSCCMCGFSLVFSPRDIVEGRKLT